MQRFLFFLVLFYKTTVLSQNIVSKNMRLVLENEETFLYQLPKRNLCFNDTIYFLQNNKRELIKISLKTGEISKTDLERFKPIIKKILITSDSVYNPYVEDSSKLFSFFKLESISSNYLDNQMQLIWSIKFPYIGKYENNDAIYWKTKTFITSTNDLNNNKIISQTSSQKMEGIGLNIYFSDFIATKNFLVFPIITKSSKETNPKPIYAIYKLAKNQFIFDKLLTSINSIKYLNISNDSSLFCSQLFIRKDSILYPTINEIQKNSFNFLPNKSNTLLNNYFYSNEHLAYIGLDENYFLLNNENGYKIKIQKINSNIKKELFFANKNEFSYPMFYDNNIIFIQYNNEKFYISTYTVN